MNRKRQSVPVFKWCEHCKKDTHDTADCWGPGTVAVLPEWPWPRQSLMTLPAHLEPPPTRLSVLVAELRRAEVLTDRFTGPDPEPFF